MAKYDMTIIGGGSGGLTAARVAMALGANVLLVDKERLGGDCLNYGCVPSKSLIHVARVVHQAKEAAKLGLTPAQLQVNMGKVSEYIQGVIRRVAEGEKVYTEGVTVKFGQVSFKSPTELVLNGEVFTSRNTLIATGSRPAKPKVEGLEETGYLTNEDVFDLTNLPASIVVVGGGPAGVELGQAFERLGAKVTIIQGPERILPKEDPEVSETVGKVLASEGITIVTNAWFVKAGRHGNKKKVDYRVVPCCTFTDPEAARVGLTPDEAEKQYKKVRIVKFPWADIDRAQIEGETTGFIKLVLAGKKDEIVGAHMVGARAGELLGEIALAMRNNLTLNDIYNTIHAYPTMSSGIQQAFFE